MARKTNKELEKENKELYQELKKLSKRANQRLVRLEREYGADSWASKKLRNRLESTKVQAWTRSGRVRASESMTRAQMIATIKATKQFLNSKTSTLSGIKQVRAKQIKGIAISIGADESKLSNEEAQTLYEMFVDKDYNWIFEYIEPSEYWAMVEDAKEQNWSENRWLKEIESYINVGNDMDLKQKIIALYEHHVLNIY